MCFSHKRSILMNNKPETLRDFETFKSALGIYTDDDGNHIYDKVESGDSGLTPEEAWEIYKSILCKVVYV